MFTFILFTAALAYVFIIWSLLSILETIIIDAINSYKHHRAMKHRLNSIKEGLHHDSTTIFQTDIHT